MASILFALAWRSAASKPLDVSTALECLAIAVVVSGAVGWWAHCIERTRTRRREEALVEAIPLGGVH